MTKKIAIISFTENGSRVAKKVAKSLRKYKKEVILAKKYKGAADAVMESLDEWTRRAFKEQDAIVYIGAAGIAVRAVAPYIKSKTKDPAVLVIDEQGNYCIPLLSGHIGGANDLAGLIGAGLGSVPIITTATDLNRKWAVDVFAAKNRLHIQDMEKAKLISAKLLSEGNVSVYIDKSCSGISGKLPDKVERWTKEFSDGPDVIVGVYEYPLWSRALYLVPKAVVLGIGCKRGIGLEKIEEKVLQILKKNGIFLESVCKISSIELKKEEEGILKLCGKYGWEFETFPAESLNKAEGKFSGSEFVQRTTGVDNVCERSAVCGSGGGDIIIEKHAKDGITIAAAVGRWEVRFE